MHHLLPGPGSLQNAIRICNRVVCPIARPARAVHGFLLKSGGWIGCLGNSPNCSAYVRVTEREFASVHCDGRQISRFSTSPETVCAPALLSATSHIRPVLA